jgi:predicted RNA-binding Zn ribbon-like protein
VGKLLTSIRGQIGYNQTTVSAEQRPKEFQFDLSGGHLSLDFANTLSRRDSPDKTVEHLNTYHDLISFAQQTKITVPAEVEGLQQKAESQPKQAVQVLRAALVLREALFRTFMPLAHGKPGPVNDVGFLENAASEALTHRHIVRVNDGYEWHWEAGVKLESVLWPIAIAAADLLVSANVAKVRECEAGDCYWLFLDNSRNHSRRWCTMNACGNREKARRHYQRHRA